MSLKDKIKPLFFLISLFLTGFFSNAFASSILYESSYSAPYWYATIPDTVLQNCAYDHCYVDGASSFALLLYDPNGNEITSYAQYFAWHYYQTSAWISGVQYNTSYFPTPLINGSYVQKVFAIDATLTTSSPGWGTHAVLGDEMGSTSLTYSNGSWSYSPPVLVNGSCGSSNGQDVTIEPSGSLACASGVLTDMQIDFNYFGAHFSWFCFGENGGTDQACSATMTASVNGSCGSSNGQTTEYAPVEATMCSAGYSQGSLSQTLSGWTWSCYGYNSGTTATCSANMANPPTPPDIPGSAEIPTPTDCDTYTGIDKVLCNLGNTIQGMFLPSPEKLTELQTTMNKVGNVFPFNYLRSIGSIFSASTVSEGSLTVTFFGTEQTLSNDFFEIPLFGAVKLGSTILILLMFSFWAINYIKHFFK